MDDSDSSLESVAEADSLEQLRIDAATRGSNTDSRAKTEVTTEAALESLVEAANNKASSPWN